MMKIKVKTYDTEKYSRASKKVTTVRYDNVVSVQTRYIPNEEIWEAGFTEVDPYGEYTIITFADGTYSTFCNSYIDVFREDI